MFVPSLSWYNDHLVQNGAKDRMRFLLCLTCGVHVATGVSNDNRKRVCRQLCVVDAAGSQLHHPALRRRRRAPIVDAAASPVQHVREVPISLNALVVPAPANISVTA